MYPHDRTLRMDAAILEHLIESYLATQQTVYTFTWQGGEPTLMGARFFKRVTDLQKKFAQPGSRIANGLQTNATLIDDALAQHLARHHFLVEKDLHLGNVIDTTWESALSSPLYKTFGKQKSDLSQQCRKCAFLDLCMGDCQKHRLPDRTGALPSYLCSGWMQFLQHTQPAFAALAQWIKSGKKVRMAPFPIQAPAPSAGRNQPCPCGSGIKYKKCCGS